MPPFALDPFRPQPITSAHAPGSRRHQGIPAIERLSSGRMFAAWYTGELEGEGPGNYVVLAVSDRNGLHWKEIQVIAPDRADARAYDATLWLDPAGRLWWFWSQCHSTKLWEIFDGRAGVWCAVCDAPDTDAPVWSEPRRIAEGVMMNKPTVSATGDWLLPTALWTFFPERILPEYQDISRSNVTISRDRGRTFELITGPDIPGRVYDEHMVIEQRDGVWRLFARTKRGISQSFSSDRGTNWSGAEESGLGGPNSRFCIRRLRSGRILLVNHQVTHLLPGEPSEGATREKLSAWLSDDDGRSWYGRLLIAPGPQVSYPDFTEGADGFLYCVYDHDRHKSGQILLARFTEADVAAGELLTPGSYRGAVIAALPGKTD